MIHSGAIHLCSKEENLLHSGGTRVLVHGCCSPQWYQGVGACVLLTSMVPGCGYMCFAHLNGARVPSGCTEYSFLKRFLPTLYTLEENN